MSRKAARQQQALARERERRQAADRRRFEQQQAVEQAAADAGVELPPVGPARDPRTNPAQRPPRPEPARVGTGRRTPGQQVACGWCGQSVAVKARGPLPKWCSPACRHRAWEQDRAAASGRSAVQVLDRYVTAVPDTGPGWIEQLAALTGQIGAGPRPIADGDLDQLAAALELAQAAIAGRTRWHGTYRH